MGTYPLTVRQRLVQNVCYLEENKHSILLFLSSPEETLIDPREGEKSDRNRCEGKASISCLSYAPRPGN